MSGLFLNIDANGIGSINIEQASDSDYMIPDIELEAVLDMVDNGLKIHMVKGKPEVNKVAQKALVPTPSYIPPLMLMEAISAVTKKDLGVGDTNLKKLAAVAGHPVDAIAKYLLAMANKQVELAIGVVATK